LWAVEHRHCHSHVCAIADVVGEVLPELIEIDILPSSFSVETADVLIRGHWDVLVDMVLAGGLLEVGLSQNLIDLIVEGKFADLSP